MTVIRNKHIDIGSINTVLEYDYLTGEMVHIDTESSDPYDGRFFDAMGAWRTGLEPGWPWFEVPVGAYRYRARNAGA
jgi:hypothetical protein